MGNERFLVKLLIIYYILKKMSKIAKIVFIFSMAQFHLNGINHLALVCSDMAQTVDFYTNILGLKLIKTISLPNGGQHFFFQLENGDAIAFFWFPDAPTAIPGISSVKKEGLETGDIRTAKGSMNHLAFNVAADKLVEYREKLLAQGIPTTPILHHADVPSGFVAEADETTFLSSFYFFDPDGILLEFAATVRQLGDPQRDLQYQPANHTNSVN